MFDEDESGPNLPMLNSAFNDGIRATSMYVRGSAGLGAYSGIPPAAAGQVCEFRVDLKGLSYRFREWPIEILLHSAF